MPIHPTPSENGADSLWLSDLSPHDKPWDIHRASAETVCQLYKQIGYERYSERVRECSKWLEFALRTAESGEMTLKLFLTRFCRVRHCPVCQWRKSLMWRARFLRVMPTVVKDYPTARYIFLTLTVRNRPVDELRETVKLMNNAWQKLVKRKQFTAIGFVRSLEVTREVGNGYAHPHFHCLLMVNSSYFTGRHYLSKDAWISLWQDCLQVNYRPSIKVKVVRPKEGVNPESSEALIPSLCEVLKYSVKEDDLVASADWLQEITKQLHKVRSISIGGILKDYLSEDDPEDLIYGDDDPDESLEDAPKLIFDWSTVIKKYARR